MAAKVQLEQQVEQLQRQVERLQQQVERATGQLKSIFTYCSEHGVDASGTYLDVVTALGQKLRDVEKRSEAHLASALMAGKLVAIERSMFAKHQVALGAQIQFWVDAYEALAKEKLTEEATVEIHWRNPRSKG